MGKSARFANQALQIRMSRFGCTNRPFYHIVVSPAYKPRDSKPIEQIGTYDPLENEHKEQLVAINYSRLHHWLNNGAEPSTPVAKLLGLAGFYPIHPMTVIDARRRLKWEESKNLKATDEGTENIQINAESNV